MKILIKQVATRQIDNMIQNIVEIYRERTVDYIVECEKITSQNVKPRINNQRMQNNV